MFALSPPARRCLADTHDHTLAWKADAPSISSDELSRAL
jgi:hypothetical protein